MMQKFWLAVTVMGHKEHVVAITTCESDAKNLAARYAEWHPTTVRPTMAVVDLKDQRIAIAFEVPRAVRA